MSIYYFSDHAPDPEMIKDLGTPLTTQFKGDISDIHTQGNHICFTETLYLGGQRIKANHIISAQSIIIVEPSLLMQQAWLAAGVVTLLVPQIKWKVGVQGGAVLKYCGLLQIHKIEVITSTWNRGIDVEGDGKQQASEEKPEPINPSDSFSMANLFQHLILKPIKLAVSR